MEEVGPEGLTEAQSRVASLAGQRVAALVRQSFADLGRWQTSLRSLANQLEDLEVRAKHMVTSEVGVAGEDLRTTATAEGLSLARQVDHRPGASQTPPEASRLRSRATSRLHRAPASAARPPPRRSRPGGRADGLHATRSPHQALGSPLPRPDRASTNGTATFDRKADAQAFLATTLADMQRGTWRDPDGGRITFAELADAWLQANPAKRPTTLARDSAVVRVHLLPALGPMRLEQLRPSDVKSVVDGMVQRGLAPRTVRTNYGVLRAILTWAVQNDLIARSPCRGIRLPEPAKTPKRTASADDVARLVELMPMDYRVAVLLGAMGLREAEVFGLTVGAIDFLRRTVTVRATINEVEGRFVAGDGKTVSVRTISVPRVVIDELAAHAARTGRTDPDDLVLQAPQSGPVRAANFRLRIYDPAVRAAGLDGLTHRLRHSAGHIMRAAGVGREIIQHRLGHAGIRTTADVYGSLPEAVDRGVADQLDDLFRAGCGADVVQAAGSEDPSQWTTP